MERKIEITREEALRLRLRESRHICENAMPGSDLYRFHRLRIIQYEKELFGEEKKK